MRRLGLALAGIAAIVMIIACGGGGGPSARTVKDCQDHGGHIVKTGPRSYACVPNPQPIPMPTRVPNPTRHA